MSDVEQRLVAAGRAWRDEQPEVRHVRPRERRSAVWLPLVAAAAVVALALGAVLLADRGRDGSETPLPADAPRGEWEAMPSGPLSARLNPVMAGWGDTVAVVGGRVDRPCPPNASCVRDLRETQRDGALYDVPSRTWTPLPPAPLPLDVSSSAVVDDVLYLWLPQEGGAAPAVLALDLEQRSWHRLPSPPALVGSYLRLVSAGGQLVAHYTEVGRADAVDLMWVPEPGASENGRWETLPSQPFGASYDRSMVWTGESLVLVTPGAPPSQERTGPPFLKAAVLEGQAWRVLPDQEVVLGGSLDWSWTGDRVVSASTYEADGGQTNGFGRSIPSGGYLDPRSGRWSELPEPPSEQERAGRAPGPSAAGGRWVANGEGLVLDTERERWIVLPEPPDPADQDASSAWAAGRLVVWGGAAGVLPAPEPGEARLLDTGAVWTPPRDRAPES